MFRGGSANSVFESSLFPLEGKPFLSWLPASDTGKFEGKESVADAIPSPYAERYPQIKRTFSLLNKQYQQKEHKKFFCRFKAADQWREPLLEQ